MVFPGRVGTDWAPPCPWCNVVRAGRAASPFSAVCQAGCTVGLWMWLGLARGGPCLLMN